MIIRGWRGGFITAAAMAPGGYPGGRAQGYGGGRGDGAAIAAGADGASDACAFCWSRMTRICSGF